MKRDSIQDMIKNKATLAPMSGITDIPFRIMCRKFGCKFAFTEMIDVNGIVYRNRKSLKYLERIPEDVPLGAQIVGSDEERILYVAKMVEEKGFEVLDLNAGCPARKVIKGGKGSALLKNPKKLGRIVGRLAKELSIPVTVKIRSGWSEEELNYLRVAEIIESEGAKAICIHPRSKDQMYRGRPRHEITKEIAERVKIPVFASGNIFSSSDVKSVMDSTGASGVFIARGALGRPWIFEEIATGEEKTPSFEGLKRIITEHYRISEEYYGTFLTHKRMYKHLTWYLKKYKNLNEIMTEYRDVKDLSSFNFFVDSLRLEGRNLCLLQEVK